MSGLCLGHRDRTTPDSGVSRSVWSTTPADTTTPLHTRVPTRPVSTVKPRLADLAVPTLVVEAPEDPINPPPHASHLTRAIGNGNPITIAGMAHALSRPVLATLAGCDSRPHDHCRRTQDQTRDVNQGASRTV